MTIFCLSIETVLVRSQKGNKVNKWGRKEGRKRGEEGREKQNERQRREKEKSQDVQHQVPKMSLKVEIVCLIVQQVT